MNTCLICESPTATERSFSDTFSGVLVEGLAGLYCGDCDDWSFTPEQAKANAVIIRQAKKSAEALKP